MNKNNIQPEFQSSKSEIRNKSECSNDLSPKRDAPNCTTLVLEIWSSVIGICFGFRHSGFGFRVQPALVSSLSAALLALGITGCENRKDAAAAEAASLHPQIQAALLSAEPSGALSVLEARKTASPGAAVTIAGRIAGAMEPFSTDYATFILADESLETCERNPGDECETPWDACCVEPKTLAALRVSVQINGEDGRPAAQGLKGVNGLAELDGVVVTGTVADGSTPENVVIHATGIFRRPS